jgi:hypothetical protein
LRLAVLAGLIDEGLDSRTKTVPARQREPALPPAEAPGNGAQVLIFCEGLREAGREPIFSSAISRMGVLLKK